MNRKSIISFALLLGCLLWLAPAGMASTQSQSTLEEVALPLKGTPYAWAGNRPGGFDCSGFTTYVMEQLGIDLNRTSSQQATQGQAVKKSDLRAGDLVFYNTNGKSISHVGIYLEDGKFIHASTNRGVIVSDMSEAYYANRYVTARRVLSDDAYQKHAVVPVVKPEIVQIASAPQPAPEPEVKPIEPLVGPDPEVKAAEKSEETLIYRMVEIIQLNDDSSKE